MIVGTIDRKSRRATTGIWERPPLSIQDQARLTQRRAYVSPDSQFILTESPFAEKKKKLKVLSLEKKKTKKYVLVFVSLSKRTQKTTLWPRNKTKLYKTCPFYGGFKRTSINQT